jgi:hypothetical protein
VSIFLPLSSAVFMESAESFCCAAKLGEAESPASSVTRKLTSVSERVIGMASRWGRRTSYDGRWCVGVADGGYPSRRWKAAPEIFLGGRPDDAARNAASPCASPRISGAVR